MVETPEEIKKLISEMPLEIAHPNEYTMVKHKGYSKIEHRVIWEKHNGPIPKGMLIHHINGNKKDNRIENLQMMSFHEHMQLHKKW